MPKQEIAKSKAVTNLRSFLVLLVIHITISKCMGRSVLSAFSPHILRMHIHMSTNNFQRPLCFCQNQFFNYKMYKK